MKPMPARLRGTATALLLILLGAATGCRKKSSASLSRETMVASETAAADFVHPNYRFGISGLDNRWKIMTPDEAAGILPDAAAMAVRVGGVYGAVVVEPLGDVDPSDYLGLIMDNMSGVLLDADWSKVAELDYKGMEARQVEAKGLVNGIRVQYEILAFIHQGYGYQLLAWHTTASGDAAMRQQFFDAITLEEGEITAPEVVAVGDFNGVGRRVHEGRYESPAYRLAMTPPEGWKLMTETELLQNTDGAEVGMANEALGTYIIVTPEFLPPSAREDFRKRYEDEVTGAGLGDEAPERLGRVAMKTAGTMLAFERTVVDASLPLRMYQALHFEGPISYKFAAWHFEQRTGSFEDQIRQGLSGIEFLSEEEAARIGTELLGAPDPQAAVGPSYALRDGLFRDFDAGVVWKKPAGFWRFSVGDAATLANPDITMQAEEASHGLYLQLISQPADDWESDEFHEAIRNHYASVEGFGEPVDLPGVTIDGAPARGMSVLQTLPGLSLRFEVFTTIRGGHAHQILMWGWPEHLEDNGEVIRQAVEGFRFPGADLQAVEKTGNSYLDRRVGFSLKLRGTGWTIRDNLQPAIQPIGNTVNFSRRDGSVMLLGLHAQDTRNTEATTRRLIEGVLNVNFDRASESGLTKSSAVIDGEPANLISFKAEGEHNHVATFSHQGSIFLLVATAGSQSEADKLLENARAGFRFEP